jgi:hypothetical protein
MENASSTGMGVMSSKDALLQKLKRAGSGLQERAQQPWWGVTPEDIAAAAEYFGSMTRNPFRRS